MRRLLLLLRHAKAAPATDAVTDISRPLAARGAVDARLVGGRLAQRYRPHLILSSPATRALQTATLVAEAVGYAPARITLDDRLYLAEPATLLAVVAAQGAAVETLLVVGHNPGLTELAQRLAPELDVDDLPTCSIVGLELDALADWSLAAVTPKLVYYDFPRSAGTGLTNR